MLASSKGSLTLCILAAFERGGRRGETMTSVKFFSDPVLESMATRRSISKVGPDTPGDEELAELLAAVTSVADHKALRPWRLILLRGDDRMKLAEALDAAAGEVREPGDYNTKPFRAELLIALVASPTEHPKVPTWEQHAVAAGVGHLLELALWAAGWGVMWRTGLLANSREVRAAHGLTEQEHLMGWLYVGSIDDSLRRRLRESKRPALDPHQFLGRMPP
ncbi:nitroreductase [Mycolicibacterium novocastrense]|uniref:nitroreductase family protein n=1 Tax=Mycolicibacterium novocastrense TaxID=59813 RepID=UPI001F47FD66|nr:nitroreductase [Mycolicibacterium novocastrense]